MRDSPFYINHHNALMSTLLRAIRAQHFLSNILLCSIYCQSHTKWTTRSPRRLWMQLPARIMSRSRVAASTTLSSTMSTWMMLSSGQTATRLRCPGSSTGSQHLALDSPSRIHGQVTWYAHVLSVHVLVSRGQQMLTPDAELLWAESRLWRTSGCDIRSACCFLRSVDCDHWSE